MREQFEREKQVYDSIPIPAELPALVQSAVQASRRRRRLARLTRRLGISAACLAAAAGMMTCTGEGFANAVSGLPVVGQLARLFTQKEVHLNSAREQISAAYPALEGTGSQALEQRVNETVSAQVQSAVDQAQTRGQARQAAWEAGGSPAEGFMPAMLHVNYEMKCANDQVVSFLIYVEDIQASSWVSIYPCNIDLKSGADLTLADVLGPDWQEHATRTVLQEMDAREARGQGEYFRDSELEGGFAQVEEGQQFYLNSAGNPVLLFEACEVAPGYMGTQEFEVVRALEPQPAAPVLRSAAPSPAAEALPSAVAAPAAGD